MRRAGICLEKESTEDSPQINSNPAKTILNKLWWRIPAPCPLLAALHTDRCLKSRKYGSFQQQQQSSVVGAFLCFTVLLGWLAQDVLLASMLFWAFLLAAVFLPLPPETDTCKLRKVSLPFIIIAVVISLISVPTSASWAPIFSSLPAFFPGFHSHPAPLQWGECRLTEELPCCLATGRPTEITPTQISLFGHTIK